MHIQETVEDLVDCKPRLENFTNDPNVLWIEKYLCIKHKGKNSQSHIQTTSQLQKKQIVHSMARFSWSVSTSKAELITHRQRGAHWQKHLQNYTNINQQAI